MGKLVKEIRSNLLNNKKNSFNIGFSNRSPFSYQLPSADPNSGVTPIDPPDMDDGTVEMIQAQGKAAADATRAFGKLASSAITEAKKQYSDKDIAEEKALRVQKRADNKNLKADKKEQRMDKRGGGSEKQEERLAKLRSKATDLETKSGDIVTDINAGEYSDVSEADLETSKREAATASAKKVLQDEKDACAKAGGNWVNGKCDK
jgi:hypothetical protein